MTHNTVIRLTLCRLLGIPLAHYRDRFPSVRSCHLNHVRVLPGKQAALLQFNAPLSGDWGLSDEAAENAGS